MLPIFEKQVFMPIGIELQILLNSEHISYGEIQNILKQKGIFVKESAKSKTVPILTATLLTPSEFDRLIESSVVREQKTKIKNSTRLSLQNETTNWIEPLRDNVFSKDFNPFESIENIESNSQLNVIVDSEERIRIPYSIRRNDYSRDYLKRNLEFSGEVIVEQNKGSLTLRCSSSHTSPETEKINKRIISQISRLLKNNNLIQENSEKKIIFGAFSSVERVRFFKRLTGGFADILEKGNIHNMEIKRDLDGPSLPNDPQIAWMKDSVTHLKVDGNKLNNIFLISNEKYYRYYHVQKLDITYPYFIGANEGNCRLSFYFGNSAIENTKDNAELVAEFSSITFGRINYDAKKQIEENLKKAIDNMLEKEFDKIIYERK